MRKETPVIHLSRAQILDSPSTESTPLKTQEASHQMLSNILNTIHSKIDFAATYVGITMQLVGLYAVISFYYGDIKPIPMPPKKISATEASKLLNSKEEINILVEN